MKRPLLRRPRFLRLTPPPPCRPTRPPPTPCAQSARYAIIAHVVHLVNRDYAAMCRDYYA